MTDKTKTLAVTVLSPEEILYQGSALSVSSENYAGKFDILPKHASFLTFINNHPIEIVKVDQTKKTFNFDQGIIYIKDNIVKIYTKPQLVSI